MTDGGLYPSGQPSSPPHFSTDPTGRTSPMTENQPYVPTRTDHFGGGDGGGGVLLEARTTDSPRWLKIVRDVLLSIAALLVSVAIIFTGVALYRAGNAIGDAFDSSTTTPTETQQAPAICYLDPSDVSCPPGFDPNAGG